MTITGTETEMTAPKSRELFTSHQIAPSILSSDFARLGAEVEAVMDAGARVIHVDVMDGQFVPPITIGPLVVAAIADQVKAAGGVLDVHLMIANPDRQIDAFAKAGADAITIHAEATSHVHRAIAQIKDAGVLAGIALNPGTSVAAIAEVAGEIDLAICMSVNPGWGGQQFIEASLGKLARLRELLPSGAALEVDGGVDLGTAGPAARAGANLLVAGSAIFGKPDPAAAYAAVVASIEKS